MVDIITGQCDGTGALINVCLGFIPDKVVVWNMEDDGNKEPKIEWVKEMLYADGQMYEGIKDLGISDNADFSRTVLASGDHGITVYNGGDWIIYDGVTNNRWETPAGADAEEIYVDGLYKRTSDSDSAYRCYGDRVFPNPGSRQDGLKCKTAAGFSIGTDSDMNVNGQQICWVVFRCN
jgi:hypothetical protein